MQPVIYGLAGEALTADEQAFLRECEPAGYILFGRNARNRTQLRTLTDSLRALHGRDELLIMIDQEGGRVARMPPPEWPAFPAGAAFDALYERAPSSAMAAARANGRALAAILHECGINVDALPLLDVRQEGASDVIGDRALGAEPLRVAALGRATLEGLRAGGVAGIVKHMPGHGRALVDSHHALPVIEADGPALERDLAPFRALAWAPIGMTAHIVYAAWDAQRPASLSPWIIERILRQDIGFDGLLMSDDLDMKALGGSLAERAAGVVAAGCDLALNCWGRMEDMVAIANVLPEITPQARARLDRAMATIGAGPDGQTLAEALADRDRLLDPLAA